VLREFSSARPRNARLLHLSEADAELWCIDGQRHALRHGLEPLFPAFAGPATREDMALRCLAAETSCLLDGPSIETNRIHLVLFGMKRRTFGSLFGSH
jgi:hypothetical protein